jgi:Fe-S oxidoreductase
MLKKNIFLFPSCATKIFEKNDNNSMIIKIKSILNKLNYNVEFLDLKNECCGLMYHSMGHPTIGKRKFNQLVKKIRQNNINTSENYAVLIENSSCFLEILSQSSENNFNENWTLPFIQDPITLIYQELKDYPLKKQNRSIMLHVNCSVAKLKQNEEVISLAKRCAENVIIPNDILCCGFSGSKGFTHPELNQNALKTLKEFIPDDCIEGYTCLETCALGFSKYSGIPYSSLFHLIDECMG